MSLETKAKITTIAYRNFIETCRSSKTRQCYKKALHYFMSYLRVGPEDYDKLLPLAPNLDVKTIQMNICDYISYLRKKGLGHQSIASYIAAIRKFYDMNDITTLNWKKIHSFMGESENQT